VHFSLWPRTRVYRPLALWAMAPSLTHAQTSGSDTEPTPLPGFAAQMGEAIEPGLGHLRQVPAQNGRWACAGDEYADTVYAFPVDSWRAFGGFQ
jgi:hypothetical protein